MECYQSHEKSTRVMCIALLDETEMILGTKGDNDMYTSCSVKYILHNMMNHAVQTVDSLTTKAAEKHKSRTAYSTAKTSHVCTAFRKYNLCLRIRFQIVHIRK